MNVITTSLMGILYYFIGTPFLVVIVPLLIRRWVNSLSAPNKLKGKVVLITGASSGLGECLAHEFYKLGCKVILAARRLDQLQRVKADLMALQIDDETHTPEVIQMDVGELDKLASIGEQILKMHGRVDILVNNAGVSFRGRVDETGIDIHQRIMMVNYFGQICLTKILLPPMVNQKSGLIVMVNSVQGKISIPFRSAYGASKHALQAYSDSLRAEMAETGVSVLVVNPGYINTPISLNAITASGTLHAKMDDATAGGYSPVDVAKSIITAINSEDKEVVMAPIAPKMAIILRTLWPNLYFLLMQRRASKNL